ncbi:MAG: glutathione S-transferase family protein [Polyangiaceae bacterium]
MALTLYFHPLSSFCMKALIALYENDTPFEPRVIHLEKPESRAELAALWPLAKFPVITDTKNGETVVVAESSTIIEYLDEHYPGKSKLVPTTAARARRARHVERIHDLYINMPVGKFAVDTYRPEGKKDPLGVAEAMTSIETAYGVIEKELANNTWAIGDDFTMADCAAAPALFFANHLIPLKNKHQNIAAYLGRLMERPSVARVMREAAPFLKMFPGSK